jgi:hypothetical protein
MDEKLWMMIDEKWTFMNDELNYMKYKILIYV